MTRKTVVSIGLLLVFWSSACRPPADKDRLVRLLDTLRLENIRRSPFLEPQTARLENIFHPYHSVLLSDEGAGENPFGLKRKLNRSGIDFNILFAPPSSEYVIDLGAGPSLSLDFGVGIIMDANAQKLRGKSHNARELVVFDIILESDRKKKTLFTKSVTVPADGPESRMILTEHKLALPSLPGPSRAVFRTRGASQAFAFWLNPVFYRRPDRPLNVILVSLDTLRPDHLGCYGYGPPTSPQMDALAEESVLFRRAYATSPWTLPSHVSMLTGLNSSHHRVTRPHDQMDPAIVTLADTLRQEGFYCAAFTGGGFLSRRYGFSKGFDFYSEMEGRFEDMNSAENLGSAACRWLESRGDRNFFLFLHTYQIHDPYSSPAPYNRMFLAEGAPWDKMDAHSLFRDELAYRPMSEAQKQNLIGLYDGEIRYTDDNLIKPLVKCLKRLGLYEPTLLILVSDHGEEFYEHGAWLHSRQLYEESIRILLLAKFPGGRFPGRKVAGPVSLSDLVPTILDIVGVDRAPAGLDGISLLPTVKNGRAQDRPVLAEVELNPQDTVKRSLVQGWNKIIRNDFINRDLPADTPYWPPLRPPLEFYNLAADPGEGKNLIDRETTLARSMSVTLRTILAGYPLRPERRVELEPAIRERLRALGYIR